MPYIGEIRLFAGSFPPRGWALCNGQQLLVSEFPDVYSGLGTAFGGDGVETFGLPDLRGRVPVHIDESIALGQEGGSEIALVSIEEMPEHDHSLVVSRSAAVDSSPVGRVFATGANDSESDAASRRHVTPTRTEPAGAGNAHNNMQPYVCLNYIIALEGHAVDGSGEQA